MYIGESHNHPATWFLPSQKQKVFQIGSGIQRNLQPPSGVCDVYVLPWGKTLVRTVPCSRMDVLKNAHFPFLQRSEVAQGAAFETRKLLKDPKTCTVSELWISDCSRNSWSGLDFLSAGPPTSTGHKFLFTPLWVCSDRILCERSSSSSCGVWSSRDSSHDGCRATPKGCSDGSGLEECECGVKAEATHSGVSSGCGVKALMGRKKNWSQCSDEVNRLILKDMAPPGGNTSIS